MATCRGVAGGVEDRDCRDWVQLGCDDTWETQKQLESQYYESQSKAHRVKRGAIQNF